MDQNNMPVNQTSQKKRFPTWVWWVIGVVGVIVLVLIGYYVAANQYRAKNQELQNQIDELQGQESEEISGDAQTTEGGEILLAYGADQTSDYTIAKYDPVTEKSETLVEISDVYKYASEYGFQVSGDYMYYVNSQGALSRMNLSSGEKNKIDLDGVTRDDSENQLSSIVISGDDLYYLTGTCIEVRSCDLGSHSMTNGTSRILFDDIQDQLKDLANDGIELGQSRSNDGFSIYHYSGDGPGGTIDIYSVNFENGIINLLDGASIFDCEYDPSGQCSTEQLEDNDKYEVLTSHEYTCGGQDITQISDNNKHSLVIDGARINVGNNNDNQFYLGCVNN